MFRWYGSWVSADATPSSDVDFCVVVATDERRPRGRDVVVLTEDEMKQLADRAPLWRKAIVGGREL